MQYSESTSVKQKKKRSLVKMQAVWAICIFVFYVAVKYCFPDFLNQIIANITELFERPLIFDPYESAKTVMNFLSDIIQK